MAQFPLITYLQSLIIKMIQITALYSVIISLGVCIGIGMLIIILNLKIKINMLKNGS